MADTTQVVRVESISDPWTKHGEMVVNVRLRGADRSHSVPVGDWIALTEQRRDVAGQDDDGTLNGEDYVETRLVSEWMVKR